MRLPFRALLALAALLIAVTACTGGRANRLAALTPVPTKTLRPTFTNTPAKPTATPSPTAVAATPTPEIPTATPEPPTPEPTPTSDRAAFTVASTTVNVRSGPGTNYSVIGQLRQGQTLTITGKNPSGDWWQFDFGGRQGWVFGQNVRVTNAGAVAVAANIPAAPTARPTATRAPQRPAATRPPAQPTQPPAPASRYSVSKSQVRPNSNPLVTFWCMVWDSSYTVLQNGTMRATRDGAVVGEVAFRGAGAWGDPGLPSAFPYSEGCKLEIPGGANGAYTAYLVEGGKQISDPFSLTVTGEGNRTAIIEWKLK